MTKVKDELTVLSDIVPYAVNQSAAMLPLENSSSSSSYVAMPENTFDNNFYFYCNNNYNPSPYNSESKYYNSTEKLRCKEQSFDSVTVLHDLKSKCQYRDTESGLDNVWTQNTQFEALDFNAEINSLKPEMEEHHFISPISNNTEGKSS